MYGHFAERYTLARDDMPSLREPPKLGKLASGNPYCGLDKKIPRTLFSVFFVYGLQKKYFRQFCV